MSEAAQRARTDTLESIVDGILESYRELGGINHLEGPNLPSRQSIERIVEVFEALIFPGFRAEASLTLAGILLGLAYQRTGNLYFSIGLHAGWIFWLKVYGAFTAGAPHAATWFWGTGKMVDGWLALWVLLFTLAIFKFLPLGRTREPFTMSR